MLNPNISYDNAYAHTNVYGHALELLKRHVSGVRRDGKAVIHIDIGCGYGRIAEALSEALDSAYVGVDLEGAGLASLAGRGYETHKLDLSKPNLLESFRALVGERIVGSISMLDTLEHLQEGQQVLEALSDLAAEHSAFTVISVPNVAHRDIGFKLAFGLWDYTEDGLLDHTHVRLFNGSYLERALRHAGLHSIDSYDVRAALSDQHFPKTHPALSQATVLHRLLSSLRSGVDAHDDVQQFVRICVAGPKIAKQPFAHERAEKRPFLSIVTRTQGKRIQSLVEVFTCLAGQSSRDFEVLIMGHKLTLERQIAVERAIEDTPAWLRAKIRLILVNAGSRTRPLNEGFSAAQGEYISTLDDDDIPMAHWVETFQKLAASNPGRLLRSVVVRQNVINVEVQKRTGIRAVGPLEKLYPSEFKFLDNLLGNFTPNLGVAFPRGVFHDLHVKFDEDITTAEDWDYIMRVATIAGVACSPAITAVYQWWGSEHSSRTDHPDHEWRDNYHRILQKMDRNMVLFPPGTAREIRLILEERDELARQTAAQIQPQPDGLQPELDQLRHELQKTVKRSQVSELLRSTSWRLTGPLRLLGRLKGGKPVSFANCQRMDVAELDEAIEKIYASRSWRITAALRAMNFSREREQ
ncbi:methyltransferase domain-containing protein [Paraburkholderia domus]|uniref:Glycosyltransferase 2-like domain-containing protein n=1 Tax=Paraburkholderia domus TaxID=2793075 RepID=A0A9N8MW02_9BURK|nr:methyltransferase domain-containing protein [Paraburkholderia domus]MBK5165059.1 methyltransferase domain-containing protein [Burkholderia sp. R-70211]CAE6882697.1 hypothetical protein R70211_02219 [Paraburkholderia domus]